MTKVFLRAAHNYDYAAASDETALKCEDRSLAHQSFKDESDINTIVERFGLGYTPPEGLSAPTYGDFTGVVDFSTAMNAIAYARESFDALPAQVRYRFQNDPQAFVEFCSDSGNAAEIEKMGLAAPKSAPAPSASVSATPPQGGGPASAPVAVSAAPVGASAPVGGVNPPL